MRSNGWIRSTGNYPVCVALLTLGESEAILGRALKELSKREQVVIATKVFNPMSDAPNDRGLSRKHIFDSIDASLRRLQTDYVVQSPSDVAD